ncbi:hypothetical protein, partial [Stenotrophomonas maltophilia]|uniref:hypothetical protein n=1 Tax=Stenotrophomonas maltophilia TaxID=40324 RepID=UPI00117F6EE5
EVVIDVSAAPNAAGQGAVATIYFNDYLLGGKVLSANGRRPPARGSGDRCLGGPQRGRAGRGGHDLLQRLSAGR